jgi:phosphatidyl-myo-inositol dimannoside synthase
MKIILFTLEYPPFKGGVASYYGNLKETWPVSDELEVVDNSQWRLENRQLKPAWLPALWNMPKSIIEKKAQSFIIGQILPLGLPALFTKLITGRPYSIVLHGMDLSFALKSKHKAWLSSLIMRHAKKIICANSEVANRAVIFCKQCDQKISIVNPGAQLPPINKATISQDLSNQKIIFSLGRLVKRKGFDMVIQAMPKILESIPDAYYYLAGKGPDEDYLQQELARLPVDCQDHVIQLGAITEAEKWSWLSKCHVFAMPSREINGDYEGFGIVYLEANACSKPVLAGQSGGVADAVVHGATGLICNPESEQEIASNLITLLSDEPLAKKLGSTGKQRVEKEFTWKSIANKFRQAII